MKNLFILMLIAPLVFAEEDRWWKDIGIYNNLYDTLLAETFEQREARFFGAAENVKSLACRSELIFNDSERNMNKCRANADNQFVKPYKKLLYLNKKAMEGIRFYNNEYKYIEPSIAASLIVASWGAMLQFCIPENQGEKNNSNSPFTSGCVDKYTELLFSNLYVADKYTRVKFLERRGVFENNLEQDVLINSRIEDASSYEIARLIESLEDEFIETYCRSGYGIIIESDSECRYEATQDYLSNIEKWVMEDLRNFKFEYVDKSIAKAFAIQFLTIGIEKCIPYTLTLDKNFDRRVWPVEEREPIATKSSECVSTSLEGYYDAMSEINIILKREDEWKRELERQRQQKIIEARAKKEREERILQAKRERESERESVGSLFGRLLAAVIVESAETYVKEKIAKELNIKTGVYHSQDSNYCYYSTPTGTKKIKKKSGRKKTINYANVGTNKPVITSTKMKGGWSQKNTIYNFSESHVYKVQKTMHYSCPSKI